MGAAVSVTPQTGTISPAFRKQLLLDLSGAFEESLSAAGANLDAFQAEKQAQLDGDRLLAEQLFGKTVDCTNSILYFSYGSNMGAHGLALKNVQVLASTAARIEDYRLAFNIAVPQALVDPSYANITAEAGSAVHGMLHLMPVGDVAKMDRMEFAYDKAVLPAITYGGVTAPGVMVYVMTSPPPGVGLEMGVRPPSTRYRDLLLHAARKEGLDGEYIRWLEAHPVTVPPVPAVTAAVLAAAQQQRQFTVEELCDVEAEEGLVAVYGMVFLNTVPKQFRRFWGGDLGTFMAKRFGGGDSPATWTPPQRAYVEGHLAQLLLQNQLLGCCQIQPFLPRLRELSAATAAAAAAGSGGASGGGGSVATGDGDGDGGGGGDSQGAAAAVGS